MTTNPQVSQLTAGVEYELHDGTRMTFEQVFTKPSRCGYYYGMTADGSVIGFSPTTMPRIPVPEPRTPAPTWEWRQVKQGDLILRWDGTSFFFASHHWPATIGEYRWVAELPKLDNASDKR